ncbi:MAG: hypothetical protein JW741_06065 [Sedimentisphaerales bacterium]|nr:hypothetical protein [Sedimentisphaerales bacterium]
MYAVNTVALMNASKMPEYLALWLVLRDIVTAEIVEPVRGVPGHNALLVRDDVSVERWQAVVAIVRKRLEKNQFPMYEKSNGRWKQV